MSDFTVLDEDDDPDYPDFDPRGEDPPPVVIRPAFLDPNEWWLRDAPDEDVSSSKRPCRSCKGAKGGVYKNGPGSRKDLAIRMGEGGRPFKAKVGAHVATVQRGTVAWFVGSEAEAIARRGLFLEVD